MRREAVAVGAAGIVLLGLALPRLGAAVAELPGRPVMEHLEAERPVSDADFARLADAGAAAIRFTPRAAAAHAAQAAGLLGQGDRDGAARALAAGLALSPADPYGWTRLAHLRHQDGDVSGAARAVSLAIETGRWEREVAFDRAAVAAPLYAALDAPTRRAVLEQIAWCWDLDRPGLLRRIDPVAFWPLYRRALAQRPDALALLAPLVGMD